MHPLKQHLSNIRENSQNGEYGETLETLTKQLGISKPTLYRLYHKGHKRRTLSPANAIKLEILTNGSVPAESVNDDIGLIFAMVAQLVQANIRTISVIT
jgi:AcrR family transcriptional regulator